MQVKAGTPLSGLSVKGNKLYANGAPLILKGMDYKYFAFNEGGSWMLPDGSIESNVWDPTAVQDTLNFMQASNCNALRLMLCVQFWLDNSNNYQSNIEYVITQAASRGIYTDLTFYNNNPYEGQVLNVNPWEDPGNNVLNSSADFVNLWGNVSSTLKGYPTVIFELWNEPNGNETEWFSVTQQCITAIRDVGATQPINIMYNLGVAYDWGNGGVNWLNSQIPPFNMAWVKAYPLKDPLGNLIYSTHLYRFSFYNSSVSEAGLTQSGYQEVYSYSDMLYGLNVTGVLGVAALHPLVIFEMGYNNWAYDPANESTWFNATLTILDQYGIGYCDFALPPPTSSMQQWSLVQTGEPPNDDWTGSGVANYALDAAGVILVNHMGGMNYSDYLVLTQGVLNQFVFDTIGSPQTAGTPFKITIRAVDSSGNTMTNYNGMPSLSDTSGTIARARPTITSDFIDGVWTGSVTVNQAGSDVIIVTDSGGASGSSGGFMVDPAGLDHFVFNAISSAQIAGSSFGITVTAKDVYGNRVTNYAGTPSLTYSAGSVSPLTMNAFVNGVGSTSVTVTTAGSGVTLGVNDGSGHTGTSNTFMVTTAAASKLAFVGVPASLGAGVTSGAITVELQDQYGNPVDAGSVITVILSPSGMWYSNSPGTTPISSVTISSGSSSSSSFYFMGTAVGPVSLSASTNGYTAASASLAISAAGTTHFVVSGFPTSTTAGVTHLVTVTAEDAHGNTVTGYAGTVAITSSGSKAILPANAELTNGVGSFIVTLVTAGSQSITATDTANSSLTGSQTGITVNAAGLDHFIFNTVGTQTDDSPFSITVTAVDLYGNTVTSYSGTPALTYSAGSVTPSSATGGFSNGIWNGSITVTAAGSGIILGVNDGSGHTGMSNPFTVNPTIDASAGANGAIGPSGSVIVNYGGSQSFTITANAGYYIVDVLVNGSPVGAVSSYTFTNVEASYTISATFAPTPTATPSARSPTSLYLLLAFVIIVTAISFSFTGIAIKRQRRKPDNTHLQALKINVPIEVT
jgi:hypothetical protein